MTRSTKRLLIFGLIGLVLLVAVVVALGALFGGDGPSTSVETAAAQTRTITQVVTASGRIEPATEVTISPDVSGEIVELTVKEGDDVVAGQVLARIRPDLYAAQIDQLSAGVQQSEAGVGQASAGVAQAEANVAQAEAGLARAEQDFARIRQLFERGLVARSEYETAQVAVRTQTAGVRAAQAAVASSRAGVGQARYGVTGARARLAEVQNQISRTTVTAPMSGTVSMLDVELGERVVGTSQMAGTPMMRIARLEAMELVVDVNENDVVNVSVGDTARIEVDAFTDRPLHGIVTEIAQSARGAGGAVLTGATSVTTFQVRVRVETSAASASVGGALSPEVSARPDPSVRLRPGMNGTVDIFTRSVRGVAAVPLSAVTVRDLNAVRRDTSSAGRRRSRRSASSTSGGTAAVGTPEVEDIKKVVFVVRDGKAQMVTVETGLDDRTWIEIRRGLRTGDIVVTGPYGTVSRTLAPGERVRISNDAAKTD